MDFSAASPAFFSAGLEWIRVIQGNASPALTLAMKIITNLVSEYVFIVLLMAFYWLWNERKTFPLAILVIVSLWCNDWAKSFFAMPRPFHLDGAVGMIAESGYGFPSGHAQFSLTLIIPLAGALAGTLVKRLSKLLVWIAAGILCLLVAFSRIYLGVHFPWDIAGGWFLGAFLLAVFFLLQGPAFSARRSARWAARWSARIARFFPADKTGAARRRRYTLAAAALAALTMNALLPHNVIPGALLLGFCAGYILVVSPLGAPLGAPSGTPGTSGAPASTVKRTPLQILCLVCAGSAGAALIYLVLKAVFPGPASSFFRLFRFVRYVLLSFWISGGAPALFRRFPGIFGSWPPSLSGGQKGVSPGTAA